MKMKTLFLLMSIALVTVACGSPIEEPIDEAIEAVTPEAFIQGTLNFSSFQGEPLITERSETMIQMDIPSTNEGRKVMVVFNRETGSGYGCEASQDSQGWYFDEQVDFGEVEQDGDLLNFRLEWEESDDVVTGYVPNDG